MERRANTDFQKLDREHELALVKNWQLENDRKARDALMEAYDPLIVKHARLASKSFNLDIDDCLQTAKMAFITTLDKFDTSFGNSVGTYAQFAIAEALTTEAQKYTESRVRPAGVSRKIKFYLRDELNQHNEFNIPMQEVFTRVAEKSGIEREKIESYYLRGRKTTSLNATIGEDLHLENVIADDRIPDLVETIGEREDIGAMMKALENVLDDRERTIILAYYGFNGNDEEVTFRELGDMFNVSGARVSQIKDKALGKINAEMERAHQTITEPAPVI